MKSDFRAVNFNADMCCILCATSDLTRTVRVRAASLSAGSVKAQFISLDHTIVRAAPTRKVTSKVHANISKYD